VFFKRRIPLSYSLPQRLVHKFQENLIKFDLLTIAEVYNVTWDKFIAAVADASKDIQVVHRKSNEASLSIA